MSTSLLKIKIDSKAREKEEKRMMERKKAIILLINEYLIQEGYSQTSTVLLEESSIKKKEFIVADNIDMEIIFRGFEDLFVMKFGKIPVLFKKNENFVDKKSKQRITYGNFKNVFGGSSKRKRKPNLSSKRGNKKGKSKSKKEETTKGKLDFMSVSKVTRNVRGKITEKTEKTEKNGKTTNDDNSPPKTPEDNKNENDRFRANKMIKPLPFFYGEYRELAESIRRDIIVNTTKIYWNDIVGLEKAKKLVVEAVVMPMKYPELFTGVLTPWKGILLFGPPGTGKTMLAKAVASECKTTFFNISASSIVSKWRGDSEKLIRVLFQLAKYYAPSTIFLDELDSILCQRSGQEHQASRRMKTELLIQMDGISKSNDHIFFLAASNLPWDLDSAVLRRLEKRILVGLPSDNARAIIFKKLLSEKGNDLNYNKLSELTKGFSGADIASVCKEALMRPVRKIMKKLEVFDESKTQNEKISKDSIKVTMKDAIGATKVTKPSGSKYHNKYIQWNLKFGAHTDVDVDSSEDDDDDDEENM